MTDERSFKMALYSIPICVVLVLGIAPKAAAWDINPKTIVEAEGAIIQLDIEIAAEDWIEPDQKWTNECFDAGISASLVARYYLHRVNGSARFSNTASADDLHLASSGIPKSDLYILWCSPGWFPEAYTDTLRSIVLHEDNKSEGTETAELELYKLDLKDKKTFITAISIAISDTEGIRNTNTCSSFALGGDTLTASGSLSATDCDDGPRGSGYLADSYTFTGKKGETVSIRAAWTNMDGYLYLEAPGGSVEDENDYYNSTSDSQIDRVLNQDGTYTIWVTTNDPQDTGDYEISLAQDAEHPVDWSLNSVVASPSVLTANDLLSISVVGKSNAAASFFSGGGVDVAYLLSVDETISASDSLLGSERYCCATGFDGEWQGVVDADPGTYWVGACITTPDDNMANNCMAGAQIRVEAAPGTACAPRAVDCGTALARNLAEASCTEGPQGQAYLADEFTFAGESGATFWLDADWEFDGYLLLQGPGGKIIAENDDHTGPSDSHIEHTLQETGAYTIWATSYQPGATGSYQLWLDCARGAGPDLTLDAPVLETELLLPGQRIGLSVKLRNPGDQPADSTRLHYVLSADAYIDSSDAQIGFDSAPGLAAGASSTRNFVLAAPITAGEYWIGVCASRVPHETAVSNNCSAGRHIEVEVQPPCTARAMSCGELRSGVLNGFDCTRSPRGVGFMTESLEFVVDSGTPVVADAAWTGFDGYLLLEDPSGAIVASNDDADDLLHSRIEYTASSSGIHHLWMSGFQRDGSGSYDLELECGPQPAPDLVASAVTLSASQVNVADRITIAAEVQNAGKRDADPGTVDLVLSFDDKISADDEVIGSLSTDAIAAGSNLGIEASVDAPSQAGNYWLGICAAAAAEESLTANNCAGAVIRVSTGADCTGSALSCGQQRQATLGENDCDLGPRGTGYFSDIYSFTANAGDSVTLIADWADLDGYLYLEDPAGEIIAEDDDDQGTGHSRLDQVLEQSGTYRVWPSAQVQGVGGSYELSLNCNAPDVPDLLVEEPQLSDTRIKPGQNLALSAQVVNQGEELSAGTSMRFMLADNPALSANDRLLEMSDVSALPPGDSSTQSISITLDAAPGTYWVAACVNGFGQELNTANNCAFTGPLIVEENKRPMEINAALNDAWYNPATNGQGFFINIFPNHNEMFLSWFTFDVDRPDADVPHELGDPGHRWLTALGTYQRGIASLQIYLNQGGVFDQSSPLPEEVPYGTMTVSFSDCNHGQIEFDMPAVGEQGTIPITRVATDNVRTCEEQAGAPASQDDNSAVQGDELESAADSVFNINPGLNSAWYSPATDGQGFSLSVFPRLETAFMSWFTYDTEPPPDDAPALIGGPDLRWLAALGRYHGDRADLTLYSVEGGVFNSGTPAPEEIEYGTMTVYFDDCNSAEVHYDIPSLDRQGIIPIQRIAADTVPACEQAQLGPDLASLNVSPGNKDVLENFCGGTASWLFNWPDEPQASGYIVELWRNDALRPMKFMVGESEFHYEKDTAIPGAHLKGWKWRYQPQYTVPGKTADFSQIFTFDVGTCE